MRIGLDFDNTIVNYDRLFYQIAIERGVIPNGHVMSKNAIRDYLHEQQAEQTWREIQGYVYGYSMIEHAQPYDGVIAFIQTVIAQGAEIHIVSHKTRYPYDGECFDMHLAANHWLDRHVGALIPPDHRNYCESLSDKVMRINELELKMFIDDLPKVLNHPNLNLDIRRLLFDPVQQHTVQYECEYSWANITRLICGKST